MVMSDGQSSVMESLKRKTEKAIQLYDNLTKNVNGSFEHSKKEFNKNITLPKFI